jgi:hypothetical protein
MTPEPVPMSPITIIRHEAASARCAAGDWEETADGHCGIAPMLSNGAMHAMTFGHRVFEHIDADLTVDPL